MLYNWPPDDCSHYNSQLIGVCPMSIKALLHRLKHRDPKNGVLVFRAPRGLGWEHVMIVCLVLLLPFFPRIVKAFFNAGAPHNKNTTFLHRRSTIRINSSVNSSQPCPLWELASPFRTVNRVLSNKTPWYAHLDKFPWFGMVGNSTSGSSNNSL